MQPQRKMIFFFLSPWFCITLQAFLLMRILPYVILEFTHYLFTEDLLNVNCEPGCRKAHNFCLDPSVGKSLVCSVYAGTHFISGKVCELYQVAH